MQDVAYHELSMVNSSIPSWSALHKVSKQIDSKCEIYAVPGSITGKEMTRAAVTTLG